MKEIKLYPQKDNVWIKTNIKGFKFKVHYFRLETSLLISILKTEKPTVLIHSFSKYDITNKSEINPNNSGKKKLKNPVNIEFGNYFVKIIHIIEVYNIVSNKSNCHNW